MKLPIRIANDNGRTNRLEGRVLDAFLEMEDLNPLFEGLHTIFQQGSMVVMLLDMSRAVLVECKVRMVPCVMQVLQGGKYAACHEVNLLGTKIMGMQGPPGLLAILASRKLLHMLPRTRGGKHCMEDRPYLVIAAPELRGERSSISRVLLSPKRHVPSLRMGTRAIISLS